MAAFIICPIPINRGNFAKQDYDKVQNEQEICLPYFKSGLEWNLFL